MSDDIDEAIKNITSTPYGGQGLGIGQTYPVERYGTWEGGDQPEGWDVGLTTWEGLRLSGFDRGGDGPTYEDEDGDERPFLFYVLLDPDGEVVASWDEGRWWTPGESEAFLAAMQNPVLRMLAQATERMTGINRRDRRRKRRGRR